MADFDRVKQAMKQAGNNAWDFDEDEVREAAQKLADHFDDAARDEMVSAMTEASNPQEAMSNVTDELGTKPEFTGMWADNDVLQNIKYATKESYSSAWEGQDDVVNEIYDVFESADIPRLNSRCAEGDFAFVYEELGEPDDRPQPSNFADCASLVAEAKDISSTLRNKYRGS